MTGTHTGAEHVPVLAREVVQALKVAEDGHYADATYGRGGHSRLIAQRLGTAGRLLLMDRDPEAVAHAREAFADDVRVQVSQGCLSEFTQTAHANGFEQGLDGVLFDLGVSSPQLDSPGRGFSFQRDGPLDMRMDPETGLSAAQWLQQVEETELADVLWRLGEERYSRRIARAVVAARAEAEIATTSRLAQIVAAAVPTREPGKHPATRSFQAIRMHINRELDEIKAGLDQATAELKRSGRLVVISFHSLEDRMVKRFIRDQARGDPYPPDLPIAADALSPILRVTGKAQRPSPQEIEQNPRARSAVLRVAEKRGTHA